MIYIVLGMHKSGTTLISEILHHSGINMTEDQNTQLNYDQGNFYEWVAAVRFNREILIEIYRLVLIASNNGDRGLHRILSIK